MATQFFVDAPHSTQELLESRLAVHRHGWARDVHILAGARGRLTLSGRVSCFYHKQLAQEAFRGLFATHAMQNELRVVRRS